MSTFPSLNSSLTGSKFCYQRSPRHATYNYNQESQALFRNHPRLPFEYYVNISLNDVGTAKSFISSFFNSADLAQIMPLVKTVDMPAMKIDTTPLNQYNRKRLSQTKIAYEPVKMVFHDVADGKTLKFWEMYYRYYFADGTEAGKNTLKGNQSTGVLPSPTNTNGQKSDIQNIVADTLDNHNFGFNIDIVANVRNLIQKIDIFQVHGGRFNQVTLVNPRIAAFTHDVLSYAVGDKTLEVTLTFEYEYAYYTIQNMKLGGDETNNSSSLEPFKNGDFLELSNLKFTQPDPDFIESNSQMLPKTDSLQGMINGFNNNVQASLSSVTDSFSGFTDTRTSASALSGLLNLQPKLPNIKIPPNITTRPFESAAINKITTMYPDMNRAASLVKKIL